MQLSPLQSRLMASVLASLILLILYLLLFPPSFALAAEIPPDAPTHQDDAVQEIRDAQSPAVSDVYDPIFSVFDKGILGQQDTNSILLETGTERNFDLEPGRTLNFIVRPGSSITQRGNVERDCRDEGLEKRQSPTKVCISANMCMRPENTDPSTQTTMFAPQLTMYLSTSTENTSPGPEVTETDRQVHVVFWQGTLQIDVSSATDDNVYFSISAPGLIDTFQGLYQFQVEASTTEDCYFSYSNTSSGNIKWLSSDSSGALLAASDVPEQGDSSDTPYVLFAQSRDNDWIVNGSLASFCGLMRYAEYNSLSGSSETRIRKRQDGNGTERQTQFRFSGLQDDSLYWGVLALDQRHTGGQGVTVFSATNFTTRSEGGTCELMFGLEFCSDVAYPVPGNKEVFPTTDSLKEFYDNYTRTSYEDFERAMMQVPCEAAASQRYSLVRDCDDCRAAYKSWLCSVAIPRCIEATDEAPFLLPRNFAKLYANGSSPPDELIEAARKQGTLNLASRNSYLDEMIRPGPYKELLPCDTQCYNIVQSCPASLGFNCPQPGMIGFNTSYWEQPKDVSGEIGVCNNPIAMASGAGSLVVSASLLGGIVAMFMAFM